MPERDLHIAGLGAWLPARRMTASAAAAAGLYEEKYLERDGYHSVAIEEALYPGEMALHAAQAALAQAGGAPDALSRIMFTAIHRHGHARLWSPASFLQTRLAAPRAIPFNLNQGCNAALIGIGLAGQLLGEDDAILVAGADRFSGSGFNRWHGDYGLVYGDAAVAAVLTRRPGFARVVHLDTASVPELEALHRYDEPGPESAETLEADLDVRATKKRFLEQHGAQGFSAPVGAALARLRAGLERATDIERRPADWLVPPFVGDAIRGQLYERAFGDLARDSAWTFGREIGHTGTGDGLLGLWHLRRAGLIEAGSRVLVVSAGVGFTCSIMLIDIL